VTRIVQGLIKMFVLGRILIVQILQPLAIGYDPRAIGNLETQLNGMASYAVWGYLTLTFLYAYIEFSAYSDIAIGASRLYGFRIMENFNFPIAACNISDFWKRWHMTLVGWIQSYVYMPTIGLTRRPYVAVYCTFIAMGLWHGATWNWLLWGLYHGTIVSLYLTWGRIKRSRGWHASGSGPLRYAGIPITFAFVTCSYAFSATSGGWMALRVFVKLLGINLGPRY
jgi:alginate O-acetyltransferase complex protein AlgI